MLPSGHVGRSPRDLPQGGRLESAPIDFPARDCEPTRIQQLAPAPGHPRIVEALIGEVGAAVTGRAVALRINRTLYDRRLIQFGLYYRF